MKLSELISKIDDKDIRVQYIDKNMTKIQFSQKTHLSTVSFLTDQITPSESLSGEGKVGIVVWIPREKWDEVISPKSVETMRADEL
jgi:hypothetical protein